MHISLLNARFLRPNRPFHIPPHAQPIRASVKLMIEGVADQPEIVLTDSRRDYTWHVVMEPEGDTRWTADVMLPLEPTLLRYYFVVGQQKILESRQVEGRNQPVYGEWIEQPFKIAVYDPQRMPAEWTQGVMSYQIFPDRFANSDPNRVLTHHGVYGHEVKFMKWDESPEAPPLGRDFFGGDLRGITQKLDYLKTLGVECLYLNPIFEASTNHRYEAVNFMKIDPILGTQDDFETLIDQAHQRGIKVVLDAVFNHCSSDSIYFDITGKAGAKDGILGASQSKDSPYYRWFHFKNWPTDYDGWLGFGFMPEFVECPEVEAFFIGGERSVTAYWLQKGVDGWRVEVPFDNTDEFWRRFRKCVDKVKPDAYLISEDWTDATRYLLGDSFNASMNYRFAWAVRGFIAGDQLRASEFDDRLQTWLRDTPPPAVKAQMNILDSHDTDRLLNACGGDTRRYLQAVAFLLSYIGAPCVYYGDETALDGRYAEDGRRPMPWDKLKPDIYGFFKHAMNTRNASKALRLGEVETVLIDDLQRTYAFVRQYEQERVYAVFNASDRDVTVRITVDRDGAYRDLLQQQGEVIAHNGALEMILKARGVVWYQR